MVYYRNIKRDTVKIISTQQQVHQIVTRRKIKQRNIIEAETTFYNHYNTFFFFKEIYYKQKKPVKIHTKRQKRTRSLVANCLIYS